MLWVPWTSKRTNVSIIDQIGSHKMTLEEMICKQKLTYFGHVMRGEGLEKSVMLGMGGGSRKRGNKIENKIVG